MDCSCSEREKITYGTDASLVERPAQFVFFPKEKKEVQKIVRFCYENDIPVTPRGAGTGLAGGAVPTGVVVDLSRINDVYIIPEEKTAVAGAGTILADLNHLARTHGLFFPVIPSSEKVCTIGGMISTDAAGLRAMKYGRTSDWVKELTIVDGRGELRRLSGEKVKDFCGAEGTLGVVLEAVLALAEAFEEKSMSLLKFESIPDLLAVMKKEKPHATFMEYLCPISSKLVGLPEAHHLLIGYADERGETRDRLKELVELRENVGPARAAAGYTIIEDPWVPEDGLDKVLGWLLERNVPTAAHIGYGILHPRFSEENKHLIPEMHELVRSLGGLASGEHGYGIKKVKYVPEERRQKLERLKKEYDPKGIMNPGKVIDSSKYSESKNSIGCVQCGMCKTCSVYLAELLESTGARGRAVLHGRLDDLEAFYSCTLCKACDEACPAGITLSEEILRKRKELVSKGIETEANRKMIENVRRYGNPFGKPEGKITEWYCC